VEAKGVAVPERAAIEPPILCGELATDAKALGQYTDRAEELLEELPAKPDRTAEQQVRAGDIHEAARRQRARFMHVHGDQVYAELTEGQTRHLRLPELVYGAAELFTGLVPTRAQIAQERERIQAAKEGREVDQGIFFGSLLRRPGVATHLTEAMQLPTQQARRLLGEFRRTGSVKLGSVTVERCGAAGHITMSNVKCLNAEDDPSVGDMETAVDLVLLDDDIRVGVLRGGPMTHPRYHGRRVFSAGINLTDLHHGQISYVDFLLRREIGYINKILRGLLIDPDPAAWPQRTVEKPWLAAVDTFAIGGGAQLLMVFDRVIAAADAYFSLPAAQEGIVPGVSNLRLSRYGGGRLARQVILWGRKIYAHEPAGAAFRDEVVEPSMMDSAVEAGVDRLDSPAVVANRGMLNLADEPVDRFHGYLAEFAVRQVRRLYSEDVLAKLGRAWAR
jgi:thioesterase DpgC